MKNGTFRCRFFLARVRLCRCARSQRICTYRSGHVADR